MIKAIGYSIADKIHCNKIYIDSLLPVRKAHDACASSLQSGS